MEVKDQETRWNNTATVFSILDIFMYTVGAAHGTYGAAIYEPAGPLPF